MKDGLLRTFVDVGLVKQLFPKFSELLEPQLANGEIRLAELDFLSLTQDASDLVQRVEEVDSLDGFETATQLTGVLAAVDGIVDAIAWFCMSIDDADRYRIASGGLPFAIRRNFPLGEQDELSEFDGYPAGHFGFHILFVRGCFRFMTPKNEMHCRAAAVEVLAGRQTALRGKGPAREGQLSAVRDAISIIPLRVTKMTDLQGIRLACQEARRRLIGGDACRLVFLGGALGS